MLNKLITSAFLVLTGCHFATEGYVAPGRGDVLDGEGSSVHDQSYGHENGDGPILLDTYTECWLLPGGNYGWYFDATVTHSWGDKHISEIESVWVDIYWGLRDIAFELYDENVLYHPLDAPGAEIFDYQTVAGDGVWMRSEYQATTALNCDSNIEYEIHTTVYDFEGNYHTVVEYL